MNDDILQEIYNAIIKNDDEIEIFICKFKEYINKNNIIIIKSNNFYNKNDERLKDYIYNYIKSLTEDKLNKIISKYGFSKSMKLATDYYIYDLGMTLDGMYEELYSHPLSLEYLIVELIIKDVIIYDNI